MHPAGHYARPRISLRIYPRKDEPVNQNEETWNPLDDTDYESLTERAEGSGSISFTEMEYEPTQIFDNLLSQTKGYMNAFKQTLH